MSVEEIEKLVTVLGSFGFGAILSGGIVFYFIKSYIPSYLSKKAENLATKEDIAGITREVESVKIGYAAVLEEVKTNNQLRLDSIGREQSIKKEVYIRDSAANLGINCFIQNTKKLKQPSLMLLNTRYEALAAKFECIDTFEF